MSQNTKQIPMYEPGDIIRIQLKVNDESGVGEVSANFSLRGDRSGKIVMYGNGEGKETATIILEAEVTEKTVPGNYHCFYISLEDTKGNKRLADSDVEFSVEGAAGDQEAPELLELRLLR